MMALLNTLVTKGEWFAVKYFGLIEACLFNCIQDGPFRGCLRMEEMEKNPPC